MTLLYAPKPYQTDMIAHAAAHRRCALWASMGTGKTSCVLTLLQAQHMLDAGPALVMAPLRVAESTWPSESAKWRHLKGYKVQPITGTAAQRKRALAVAAPCYTINYHNLPWLVECHIPQDCKGRFINRCG